MLSISKGEMPGGGRNRSRRLIRGKRGSKIGGVLIAVTEQSRGATP